MQAILAALIAIFPVIGKILDLFKKTPVEKERKRIEKLVEQGRKKSLEINQAIERASSGNTKRLERLINGM